MEESKIDRNPDQILLRQLPRISIALFPAQTGIEKIDRLAIRVNFQGKEQLLGLPEIVTFQETSKFWLFSMQSRNEI